MNSLVSVVVPNFNHKLYLKQRLDCIFNQTYNNFEVILLDDSSTDGSQEIIKTYENHPKVSHVIYNTINSGSPFRQWQKGISLAKGQYIWIAESDDYCDSIFLEKLLNNIKPDSGLCYAQSIDVGNNGEYISNRVDYTKNFKPNIWKDNFNIKGSDLITNYLLTKNVIPNASAVIFKKELIDADYFNEELLSMKMCGDWFFWIQFVQNTNVTFINQSLNFFRYHNEVSRNHDIINQKKQRLLEEIQIREHVREKQDIVIEILSNELLVKWFRLHTSYDMFRCEFYTVYNSFFKKIKLAFQFILYKFINF